jgi:hypothetical protein
LGREVGEVGYFVRLRTGGVAKRATGGPGAALAANPIRKSLHHASALTLDYIYAFIELNLVENAYGVIVYNLVNW